MFTISRSNFYKHPINLKTERDRADPLGPTPSLNPHPLTHGSTFRAWGREFHGTELGTARRQQGRPTASADKLLKSMGLGIVISKTALIFTSFRWLHRANSCVLVLGRVRFLTGPQRALSWSSQDETGSCTQTTRLCMRSSSF